jgi:uncharacterized protein (DUF302 family)
VEEEFGLDVETAMSFDEAVARTRLVMRTHGFSILSEMPGVRPPGTSETSHLFMGLWSRLISAGNLGGEGLDVGDHLPCNVVVYTDQGRTHVAVLDPGAGLVGWAESSVAEEAQAAMFQLLEEVSGSKGQ